MVNRRIFKFRTDITPGATHHGDLPSLSQAQKLKQPAISQSAAAQYIR
jgi:hypothetical protein